MHSKPILENFPPGVTQKFEALCTELADGERKKLYARLDVLRADLKACIGSSEIDVQLAEKIIVRCETLLSKYSDSNKADERRLIIGAVRYFLDEHDAIPDGIPFVGFDDDVRIINYVVAALGCPELEIVPDNEFEPN